MSEHAGWQREVAENARRHEELSRRVERLTVTETSPDGLVKVTVSPSGALTGLELPGSLAGVADKVMDCVRRAQSRIPDLLRDAMVETVGADDPGVHIVVADARGRFPEVDPPRRPAPRAAPDEDWDGPEVFDRG